MMADTISDSPIAYTSELSAEDQLNMDFLSGQSHKLLCTNEESKATACLNGGVCFAVPELDSRRAQCMCPSDWVGHRCEEAYLDLIGFSKTGNEVTPYTIPVLLALCCVLILMVFIMLVWILREKRKRNQAETLPHKRHPLIQQISYSNYHGMRVIHKDNSEMPTECIVPVPQNSVFSTFINGGQEAMCDSDYGSNNGINDSGMLTSVHYNNNNNKETVDLTNKMINSES